MGLHALSQRLVEELQARLAVIAGGQPVAVVGEVYEETEEYFEATACCALLVAADRTSFQRHLFWSALTRRYFLKRSHEQGSATQFRCARSRSKALFSALAAGDVALALEIGDLSPEQWSPEGEYAEDFFYHLFLHRFLKRGSAQEYDTLLQQFAKALDNVPSPRFDICQALQSRASEDLDAAFQDLIASHLSEFRTARLHSTDVPTFEPRSRIFIEGLALLRIATNAGIQLPERNYELCPKIGRVKPLRDRPDDIFAQMAATSEAQEAPRRGPPRA